MEPCLIISGRCYKRGCTENGDDKIWERKKHRSKKTHKQHLFVGFSGDFVFVFSLSPKGKDVPKKTSKEILATQPVPRQFPYRSNFDHAYLFPNALNCASFWLPTQSRDNPHHLFIFVYIYIYMCVCVCVCFLIPCKWEAQGAKALRAVSGKRETLTTIARLYSDIIHVDILDLKHHGLEKD